MQNTVTPEQVKENMQDVIVHESTTCVDPANYNEEIGKEICLRKLEDKVWFLLGYQLQEQLYSYQLAAEHEEMNDEISSRI